MKMKAYFKEELNNNGPLSDIIPSLIKVGIKVDFNSSLKNLTSFRIGGRAEILITPQNEEQLKHTVNNLIKETTELNLPYFILGGGSNLLITDELLRGIVIRTFFRSPLEFDGNYLWVCGAEPVSRIIAYCSHQGLSGLEFLAGIPGTIGGSIVMNAGTNSDAIGEAVVYVHTWLKEEKVYTPLDLGFSYRSSYLQGKGTVVLKTALKVKRDEPLRVIRRVREFLIKRRKRQPITLPSAGSVFKNPPFKSAGLLLEEAGVKGLRVGGAQVSYTHANFIVNIDEATAQDVLTLMKHMQEATKAKCGVELEPEIIYIGNQSDR